MIENELTRKVSHLDPAPSTLVWYQTFADSWLVSYQVIAHGNEAGSEILMIHQPVLPLCKRKEQREDS